MNRLLEFFYGDLINPAFEVINVIGTGHRTVEYWSISSGLSVDPPEKPQRKQQSNGSQKPRGWVFLDNGRKLRIGVPDRVNYPEFVRVKGTDITGFCIEVFQAALNELPYGVPYKFVPFWGDEKTPEKLLRRIQIGASISFTLLDISMCLIFVFTFLILWTIIFMLELDGVVGDNAITTSRTKLADFTQPFIESGLVVVAPLRKLNPSAWAFLRPFTPMMWGVTCIFFLVVGAVVGMLEHRTNSDIWGPPRKQCVTIVWFSFSILFSTHKEKTDSTLGRFVLIIWLFVVLIINSSYIARLTLLLTVEQLSSPIKGIESLATGNDPIGFRKGSFVGKYLTDELNIHRSRFVPLNSPEEFEKALKDGASAGGVAAVVHER